MSANNCLACGKPVRGRIDKKFCDDYCRNLFNNKKNGESNSLVRRINTVLRRNRQILEKFVPNGEDMGKVPRSKLLELGFRFSYFTNVYTTQKGVSYHYCYDYGWLVLEGDWCLVVRSVDSRDRKMKVVGTPSADEENKIKAGDKSSGNGNPVMSKMGRDHD